METNLAVAIVAASASMATGMFGTWINASQTGKRIDDMGRRIDDLRGDFKELRAEPGAFKEMVNSKLQAIDSEIAKLMGPL
jgi:hypothetical protein